jgi:hypothetical protein
VITNTILTLVVLPTLYTAFQRKKRGGVGSEATSTNAEGATPNRRALCNGRN